MAVTKTEEWSAMANGTEPNGVVAVGSGDNKMMVNIILRETAEKVAGGAAISGATREGAARITALGFERIDYLEIRSADSLASFPSDRPDGTARILVAARIGKTRLIDNMPV